MAAHLSQSYLVAEALSATGLKNRAVLFAMDPYVKLTALPSKRSARCRKHAGGGRNPRWGGERGRLQLALAAADESFIRRQRSSLSRRRMAFATLSTPRKNVMRTTAARTVFATLAASYSVSCPSLRLLLVP